MACLFCKIIKKELPSRILFEDEKVMVIMDAYPEVDGHILIIPKKHFTDFLELEEEEIIHINKIAKDIGALLMKKLSAKSLSLTVNYGDRQEIKHYHLHLLPDYRKNKASKDIGKVYEIIME